MKNVFKGFVTTIFLLGTLYVSAQTKGTIVKGYAFVQVIIPGTIMKDDNGNPVNPPLNISRTIYIETKGKTKPVIESVQYKNEILKVTVQPVSSGTEHVGIKKDAGEPLVISASKGNTLWRLDLLSVEGKQMKKNPSPYKNIILKENKNRKYYKFTIGTETELESPLSV